MGVGVPTPRQVRMEAQVEEGGSQLADDDISTLTVTLDMTRARASHLTENCQTHLCSSSLVMECEKA